MAADLHLELPAEPASAGNARRAVARFASEAVPAVDLDAVRLAVSEAVTNAIVHAYRGLEPETVEVSAAANGGVLEVVVADGGVGMAPRGDSPGMGMGQPTIAVLADHVDVTLRRRGTRLVMQFAPQP